MLREKASLDEGHGFSRVRMSLRLTQVIKTQQWGGFRLCHKTAARLKVFSPCSPEGTGQSGARHGSAG
jgi:hypothetical protein